MVLGTLAGCVFFKTFLSTVVGYYGYFIFIGDSYISKTDDYEFSYSSAPLSVIDSF